MSEQPYKGAINQPCSACSAGDTAMEHHDHDYVRPENRMPDKQETLESLIAKWRKWANEGSIGVCSGEAAEAGRCADELDPIAARLRELVVHLRKSADAYDQKHEETSDRFYSGGASVREEDADLLEAILGKE